MEEKLIIKKGNRVRITDPSSSKHGKIGKVSIIGMNGAIIKLNDGRYTPVKFEHLEVIPK